MLPVSFYGIPLQTLLMILGPIVGVLFVLYKGYRWGQDQKELEQRRLEEEIQQRIKGAEAKNATEDWKRDQRINDIGNAKSVIDLLQSWNRRFGTKTDDPPKKP